MLRDAFIASFHRYTVAMLRRFAVALGGVVEAPFRWVQSTFGMRSMPWLFLFPNLLILGVFMFQIREQFDSLDLHHLESLRER